jgi:hypothetical protein
VVSLGEGCGSNHPHHLHHHLGEIFQIFKIDFSLRFVTPPLLWDMEEMYGATEGPCQYLGAVSTIEPNDFKPFVSTFGGVAYG